MIRILIDPEKCTGCKACINICPKGPRVYTIEIIAGKEIAVAQNPDHCLGCTNCVSVCIPKAIKLKRS